MGWEQERFHFQSLCGDGPECGEYFDYGWLLHYVEGSDLPFVFSWVMPDRRRVVYPWDYVGLV